MMPVDTGGTILIINIRRGVSPPFLFHITTSKPLQTAKSTLRAKPLILIKVNITSGSSYFLIIPSQTHISVYTKGRDTVSHHNL
jgi:hypothetical protein